MYSTANDSRAEFRARVHTESASVGLNLLDKYAIGARIVALPQQLKIGNNANSGSRQLKFSLVTDL